MKDINSYTESKLKILGIGQSVPNNVVTNFDIESITDGSNAEWIEEKLGILSRRISTDENVVTLGAKSAIDAIFDAGWDMDKARDEIDLIIVNTSSADDISPPTSCMIQNELNLKCPSFDINAVCSGFIYSLSLSADLLNTYNNILLISTETYSKITNWDDRNSCFFGDGSASVIITRGSGKFLSKLGSDGSGYGNFRCNRKSTFEMIGSEVYKFGVSILPTEIKNLLLKNSINISDIDYIIPHQPSHKILKETARILGIDESKICFNMHNFANTAGSSVPMAMYKSIKENKIQNGDNLILAAIGSGWTYGTAYFKLDYK